MKRGHRFSLVCAGRCWRSPEAGAASCISVNAPAWRHEAEVTCLQSGAVKLGTGVERIHPIEGPGMCGADFPLGWRRLARARGHGLWRRIYGRRHRSPMLLRAAPRWPGNGTLYAAGTGAIRAVQVAPVQSEPLQSGHLRWVLGPPGIERPEASAPAGQPIPREPYEEPSRRPAGRCRSIAAASLPDDIPDDAVLPPGRAARPSPPRYPRSQPAYNAPAYQPPPQRSRPRSGRARRKTAAVGRRQ